MMNKKNYYILTVIILTVITFSGCTSSTDVQNTNIKGYVYNSLGQPVANAGILLSYNTDIEPERPSTTFSFAIAEDRHVKLWITRQSHPDTVNVLIDSEMEAGCHSVEWNCKNTAGLQVMNGYYDVHILADDYYSKRTVLMNQEYYISSTGYEFNAVTDNHGFFSIPQDSLAFNSASNEVELFDEEGWYVGKLSVNRYVSVWAIHPDFAAPVSVDSIYVNESKSTVVELNFLAE